jgi:hypothetical protein
VVVSLIAVAVAKRNLYFMSPPRKQRRVLDKFKEVYLGMRGDIVLKMRVEYA